MPFPAPDYLKAKFTGCSVKNFSTKPCKPDRVVIHIMQGTSDGTQTWFNNPKAQVSAHYGVSKTGAVSQYVEEKHTAWHAGITPGSEGAAKVLKEHPGVNPNSYSIGIECEGFSVPNNGIQPQPMPTAQLFALKALVKNISKRYSIPLDRDHILGHSDIYKHKPQCPGVCLDLNIFLEYLQMS